MSFSNASRASSLYHGHQMVVAFHYPEKSSRSLVFAVADLAQEMV
jgi:hypothetical protein